MSEELRRIAHELRTYNPAADEYKGEHIHKVWAREIEEVLASINVPHGEQTKLEFMPVDSMQHAIVYGSKEAIGALKARMERDYRAASTSANVAHGSIKPQASLVTFDEFVQYGKDHGANIVNGMPWSFSFNGHAVTHETDDLYFIGTPSIKFRRGEMLLATAFGEHRLLQVLAAPTANVAQGAEAAGFEWPPLPTLPDQSFYAFDRALFTEHQMQGYAYAYGEAVRAALTAAKSGEPK